MRKLSKTLLSLLLIAAMLASFVVLPAAAEEPAAEQPTEAVQAAETQGTAAVEGFDLSIVMLDCGRKYYSVDSIKQIIDNAQAAGFGYIMLGVGNDGLRFLLDDMSLTVNGTTYESDAVKSAIHAGNEAYYNFDVDELTESEMNTILAYAKEKGMGVIPMLNTPGHMDAILSAATSLTGTTCSYNGSARTIDVTNTTAVDFTKAVLQKYIDYFAGKGCQYFNMGADEYANDKFTSGSMGFGNLQSSGKYSYYVTYVNEVAALIEAAGMKPMAFNDGIYFANNTSSGTFDTDIVICYWSSGWPSYTPMSASDLASKGFKLVNTNGDYYYVLGKHDTYSDPSNEKATDFYSAANASNFSYTSFQGSNISNPYGAMLCIWGDYPGAETEDTVVTNTTDVIKNFGATLPNTSELPKWKTAITKNGVTVDIPDLTDVEVEQKTENLPELPEGASDMLAWDITPYVNGEAYEGKAKITVKIPEVWIGAKVYGAVVNEDGSITEGTNLTLDEKNNTITFTVPHFSTILAVKEYATETINLTVGQTETAFIKGADVTKKITKSEGFDEYAELVSAEYGSKTETTIDVSKKATSLNTNDTIVLTDGKGNYAKLNSDTSNLDPTTDKNEATVWTVEKSGSSYYLETGGSYLIPSNNGSTYSISSRKSAWSWSADGGFYYVYYYYYGYTYNYYLGCNNGTWAMSTSNSGKGLAYVYTKSDTEVKGTTLTFKGLKAGTTYVTVDNIQYEVVVSDVDLTTVTPLTIEYWITNAQPKDTNGKTAYSVSATYAYGEDGVDISAFLPKNTIKEDGDNARTLLYWRGRLLDKTKENNSKSGTEEQTDQSGDDETCNGTGFTKVRYWQGAWSVYTEDNEWVTVKNSNQLVAYYLEILPVADELDVNAADWGKKGDGSTSGDYLVPTESCTVSVQVIYEDGTKNPASTDAADLKTSTIGYGYWEEGRGIGTLLLTGLDGYQIWKIEAETGAETNTGSTWGSFTVNSFKWDNNAMTVYEGDPVDSYVIHNDANNPSKDGYNANLMWDENYEAILIKVYVKAEVKEDSLKVHYIDETTGTQFYDYAITVKENTYFDEHFAKGTQKNTLVNNSVTNINNVEQSVSAKLEEMPKISATYRYSQYTLVRVVRQDDGKEVFLYYTFDNDHFFVVDFGVPLKIEPADIGVTVPEGETYWEQATCTGAVYGETEIASGEGLTYTATKPMLGIETLQVTLATTNKEGKTELATHTIYLYPATTVYYEPNVAVYTGNWTPEEITVSGTQETQKANDTTDTKTYFNFGYDDFYKTAQSMVKATTEIGASAQLTFKGTGMELYLRTQNANNTTNPEDTTGEINNVTDHSYMLVQVYAGETTDTANLKRMSFVDVNNLFVTKGENSYGYNTPCWTVDGMDYDTYTVVVRYVKGVDTYGLAINGFRVKDTMYGDKTAKEIYEAVGEDNMQTSEIRNMVLLKADVSNYIFNNTNDMYKVGENEVLDAVFDKDDPDSVDGAVIIAQDDTLNTGAKTVEVTSDLINIGPKNEIYLKSGEAVVMQLSKNYSSVQVGMRSLTGDAVSYAINNETGTMKSTVDMYYTVNLFENKFLVIRNTSDSDCILALTKLKVTGEGTTIGETSVETTPEAIRYAMALMRGIDVPQFTDVAEDAWYHDYVYDLVYRGVVNGMTATTYEPEGKLTRAQFVKLLACSLEDAGTLKTYEGQHPFKDSEGHWAEAYIAWAKDKGIVEGVSAAEFDPEAPITREQMATIFGRYALKQGIELPKSETAVESFPDADKISDYAREFVELMRIAGILNGYEDGTFRPQGNATRAEAAKLFSLFLSITDKLAK